MPLKTVSCYTLFSALPSSPLAQLLSTLLPQKLRQALRSHWTILIYIACGTAWITKSTYEGLLSHLGERCDSGTPEDRVQTHVGGVYIPPEPREYLDHPPTIDGGVE
jgi:hypothetical protein